MTLHALARWTVLTLPVVLLGAAAFRQDAPPAPASGSSSSAAAARTGTVDGDFQVNANGGASYVIPLLVPPGTNGVQPELTLSYDSQAADGLLGIGFALTGLSSISRCPANVVLDGYNGGIYFNARDRFCIDGQRLILVSGSPYGAPNTVYHTESETWTRVVAQGACGSGPCSFVAHNKDGWQLDFGTTPGSRVALPGKPEIATWQIAQTTDLNRNTVAVTYRFDATNLQNHPTEIRYTGNAATGLQPVRRVAFDYEARPDAVPRFVGGFRFANVTRLRAIRTEVSGQPVLEYRLTYHPPAPGTGRSRVHTIAQCAPGDDCLPATTFTWQDEVNTVASPNSDPNGLLRRSWCQGEGTAAGAIDFNGDGKPDLTCDTTAGNHYVLLSTGSGLKSPSSNPDGLVRSNWCAGETSRVVWIDFNGDGKGDVACNGQDGSYRVLVSNGSAVASPNSNSEGLVKTAWCTAADCLAQWGNLNADGRADLLGSWRDGTQRALISTGTQLATPNSNPDGLLRTTWCTEAEADTYWADFNGDGLGDIVCSAPSGTHKVMVSTGTGVLSPNSDPNGVVRTGWCAGDTRQQATDFNGDGLDDIACATDTGTQSLLLSSGALLTSPNQNPDGQLRTGWCAGAAPSWGDWNGDGLDDIACSTGTGEQSVLLSNNGQTLRSPSTDSNGVVRTGWCSGSTARTLWMDWNGDALGDVTCQQQNGDQLALVHQPTFPDVLKTVTNGLGGTVRAEHKPLTDSTVYTPGPAVAYPVLDVQTPLQVVSTYSAEDGRGGAYTSTLRYSGARTHLALRRWLGFHSVATTQPAIGRTSLDVYTQDYPVVGFVVESRVQDAAGTRLASSRFTPVTLNPYPNVYQVLRATETASTYTGGTADFTTVKRFRYDEHGDLILLSDLGDEAQGTLPVYSCSKYTTPPGAWGFGYLLTDKTARTEQGCLGFLAASSPSWNPAADLRWNQYGYDAAMNTTAVRNWDDRNNVFLVTGRTYDSSGLLTSETDPANRTTTFEYDPTYQTPRLQTSPPTPSGERLRATFAYEPKFGVLTHQTDPNGNSIEQRIDPFGRVVETWAPDPAGNSGAAAVLLGTHSFGRDGVGVYQETRERPAWADGDPATWFWSREYSDGLERPIRTVERGETAGRDVVTDTEYDAAGRIGRQSFARFTGTPAEWVVTRYDLQNRPLTITQPDGTVTRYDYIRGEHLFTVTEAAGAPEQAATTYQLDARGDTVRTEEANGGVSRARYDVLAQQVEHTSAIGNVTAMTYDSLGRMAASGNPDTGTQSWTYAPDGDLASNRDGDGNVVSYLYDGLGRTTRQTVTPTSGAAEVTTFVYDNPAFANSKGNLTRAANATVVEEYAYTRYSQVAAERLTLDGATYVVGQAFDPAGRLLTSTLPDGSVVRRTYGLGGEMKTLDFRESGQSAFVNYAAWEGYTAIGQPLQARFGNGLVNTFTYYPVSERLGLPKTSTLAAGATVRAASLYTWNRRGHVDSVELQIGTAPARREVFGHDRMGWMTSARGAYGNLEYGYDLSGNLTRKDGVTYTYPAGSNRMAAGSNGVQLGYDAAGNMKTRTQPAARLTYDYDGLGQMVAAQRDGGVTSRAAYDIDGNRVKRTDAGGAVSRYISADFDTAESGGTVYFTRYLRGPAGPVAAVTKAGSPLAAAAALRQNAQRLESGLYSRATLAGLAGRAGAAARRLAAWLGEVADLAAPATLALAGGLAFALLVAPRRRRRLAHGLPFSYRSRHPARAALAPLLVAALLLPCLPAPAAGDLGPGTGIPVPGTLYFHGDQLASTILITNPAGEAVTEVAYRPYGAIDQPRSSGPDHFRPKFTTKELDHDTGLYYFGSRYYDPVLGRFLTPDPAQQMDSPYVYAVNDPESYFDADGEFAELIALIIIGAVIGAVTGAYFGGAAVNGDYNPANWNWGSAKTWGGIFAGAAIGAASGAIGGALVEAGVAPAILGGILIGAGENAAFTALGGGSGKEILQSALLGAAAGGVLSAAGAGLSAGASRLGSSFARRGGALSDLGEAAGGVGGRASRAACSSFPAGTLVATEGGLVPIEEVAPGDRVLARRDAPDEAPAPYPVMECAARDAAPLVAVEVGGETIRATPQHPFWVAGRGWTEAGDLQPGDRLVTAGGAELPVTRVVPAEGGATVFNFEVASAATYFVSPLRILVHNPNCLLSLLPAPRTMKTVFQKLQWRTKVKNLALEYGDRTVWYKDPSKGRRLLDLESYTFVEGGQKAVVNLHTFGKGSTRTQHFSFADKYFSGLLKRAFKRSALIQGQYGRGIKGTWHHHPKYKRVAFVPRGLHKQLGHAGGMKNLFRE